MTNPLAVAVVLTQLLKPELTPCREPGMPPRALCGTHEVFENRAARTGRKIPLKIVVIPAAGPGRLPDPITYFAGGPGEASIPVGLFKAEELGLLGGKRDVLLVDLRGTGMSGGLFCTELGGETRGQGFLDDFLPTDKVRACRDRLQKQVDLSWYTTDAAVDDVEEVRAALGYGPLNLIGGSYGTRAVQAYLRRHPAGVRTATLDGVALPGSLLATARASQEALDSLIAECERDPACGRAYPKLREELATVLRRVAADPVRVGVIDPPTRRAVELRLTQAGLAQTLRYMLYSPIESALLPLAIHEAAQGNWKPLARLASLHGSDMSGMAEGFFLSVSCAEEVALIRDGEIAPAVAGTFLGDFRVRRQKAVCEGWPVRDLGADLQSSIVSDVPALLISGERDPATPPANGQRVARGLKRARHVVVPDGSHFLEGMQGSGCVQGLVATFIKAGTAEGLDTSCLARMRRPAFELPEAKVARADLERLPGSYVNEEMGMVLAVDLQGEDLRVSILQGKPFPSARLIPTSPTRFRWEGDGMAPGLAVVFQVAEGRATALSVIQPNKPEVVMKRSEKGLQRVGFIVLGALAALAVLFFFYRNLQKGNSMRRRVALAIVLGTLLSLPASAQLQYFGYAGAGNDDRSLNATKGFTNFAHFGSMDPNLRSRVAATAQKGLKATIDLGGVFWCDRDQNGTYHYLCFDWEARWEQWKAANASILTHEKVLAFAVLDEPFNRAVDMAEYEAVTQRVKSDFPLIKIFLHEAACVVLNQQCGFPEYAGSFAFSRYQGSLPGVDWVTVGVGGVLPSTDPTFLEARALMNSRFPSKGWIYVMDGYWDPHVHGERFYRIEDMGRIARDWYNVAWNDPKAVLLGVIFWNQAIPDVIVSKDFPCSVLAEHVLIGRAITRKARPRTSLPIGRLENVAHGTGVATGWACDPDGTLCEDPRVDLYVDGSYGTTAWYPSRNDYVVSSQCGIGIAYRFRQTMSIGTIGRRITAFARDLDSGGATLPSNCPDNPACVFYTTQHEPKGYMETISPTGTAAGWVCDPDGPLASTKVRLVLDDGTPIGTYTTNLPSEQAVADECGGGYQHRFSIQLPSWARGRRIYAYSQDLVSGEALITWLCDQVWYCVSP